MKLRFSRRGLQEAKRIKTWWRANRPASPALFEQELESVLRRTLSVPRSGVPYQEANLEMPVRRVLMPRTRHPRRAQRLARMMVTASSASLRGGRPPMMKAGIITAKAAIRRTQFSMARSG